MDEEGIEFSLAKKVFYNKEMHFCRSIFSLAVGAISEKIVLCDAFCASGIRGIRYAKENKNVKKTTFIDIDKTAIACVKKNAKKNRIKFEAKQGNFSRLVFETAADFLEVDPFGSPAPYLYDSFRVFNPMKKGYLSVTATDTAVLCGAKESACMKHYHSKPLNNEFTHEIGLRILLKKIAETAAEFNIGIESLVSLSDRHYLKTVLKLVRGADAAYANFSNMGFINYCSSCGFREPVKFPEKTCKQCRRGIQYAGQLWTGELHQKAFLEKMRNLNKKREYDHKEGIEKKLLTMLTEINMPPHFYDVHRECERINAKAVPSIENVLVLLRENGYVAHRTHFSSTGIKTSANITEFQDAINRVLRRKGLSPSSK